jgi:uncharacterized repeat protein (TIGR01451 family)
VSGNQVVWDVGAVQGVWEQTFIVQVAVDANAPLGPAYAQSEIATNVTEDDPYNNTSFLPRPGHFHEIAVAAINPTVEKYLVPATSIPTPGNEITYGLSLYNKGNINYEQAITLTDTLPANVEFITATVAELHGGYVPSHTFTRTGQTLVWKLDRLSLSFAMSVVPPGPLYYTPVWVASVRGRVLPSAAVGSSLSNVLQVSTPATDTNPADNLVTHTANVATATYDSFVTQYIPTCYSNTCAFIPDLEIKYNINFGNVGNAAVRVCASPIRCRLMSPSLPPPAQQVCPSRAISLFGI